MSRKCRLDLLERCRFADAARAMETDALLAGQDFGRGVGHARTRNRIGDLLEGCRTGEQSSHAGDAEAEQHRFLGDQLASEFGTHPVADELTQLSDGRLQLKIGPACHVGE